MPEWARVTNTTIREYVRGEENNVLRNRALTALLRSKGRITYNHSGSELDWKVRYQRAPLYGYADADTLTFPRRNRWKTAVLPWRGYASTDSVTKKEKLMNKSTEAIIKLFSNQASILMEDIEEGFGDELYVDGNASGNEKRLHGLESCMAWTQTITQNTAGATARTADAGDKAAYPNDTYAGLSTVLGNYGGTWAGDSWPDGTGGDAFDFWSPLITAYDSTAFGGASDDFIGQGDEAIRYSLIRAQRSRSKKGMTDLVMLNSSLFDDLLNLLDTKERFVARAGRTEGSLVKLGFESAVNFDGSSIYWEYGVPANVGYGINCDQMELCSLQGQLFVPEGPDYDVASKSWRFSIDFFGNLKFNPKFMFKLVVGT